MPEPITSNRAVENAAIMFVVAREAACGRTAHDTRGTGAAGDCWPEGSNGGISPFRGRLPATTRWLCSRDLHRTSGSSLHWLKRNTPSESKDGPDPKMKSADLPDLQEPADLRPVLG